eukprot:CAMPEP_0182590304 /NCGR_PEP_ID=MMETSP1324-20130603/71447_1 /TAXON_ID=236786 /ORGANISM="Florenciella sp., Strain RCC1587" /LENGTH=36 /DNA_ID= /DNA_START= /DNA_END= /DNA_ORIENTATION=
MNDPSFVTGAAATAVVAAAVAAVSGFVHEVTPVAAL